MTVILSFACPAFALQASDRLVTARRPGQPDRVHSDAENKAVIFVCHDAVGVIGYTGTAYVRGEPTDQWIANSLAPHMGGLPRECGGIGSLGDGLRNAAFRALLERLRLGLIALPVNSPLLEIAATGFRVCHRNHIAPFIVTLRSGHDGPTIRGRSRRLRTRNVALTSQSGDLPPGNFWMQIKAQVDASTLQPDEAVRQALISTIRTRGAEVTTVGRDIMTVRIANPLSERTIEWSYEPQEEAHAIYSPWVLLPHAVQCPTAGTEAVALSADGWTVGPRPKDVENQRSALFTRSVSGQSRVRPPR